VKIAVVLTSLYTGIVFWQNRWRQRRKTDHTTLFALVTLEDATQGVMFLFMNHLQWQHLLAKPSATATHDSHVTVLALATLGDTTKIG